MARKQAKRRKAPVKRQLPTIRPSLVLGPVFVLAAAAAVYELGSILLERPVNSLEISAPMQRVSVMEIEAAIEADLKRGYFTADLDDIRSTVQSLQWIDQAAVARRWPDRIAISVTEQTPAAVWGESGLMNVRGELFVEHDADHLPADLPRLAGPPERSADVARLYLTIREHILPLGLDVRRLALNERGAWELQLSNGVGVRLGRRDVDRRVNLFVDVVAEIVAARGEDIEFVDLRYGNGFTIGWRAPGQERNADPGRQGTDEDSGRREMMASRGNN